MAEQPKSSKILAHWHFSNHQWREYLYYEKLEFESNVLVDLRMILTFGIAAVSILAIIGGAKGGPAAFIFILIAGILFFGLCYFIHRMIRINAEQRLQKQTGEVTITKTMVVINGVTYDWRKTWSLPQIRKDYIYIGEEKMMLLNFRCTGSVAVRGGREQIEKKFLVPVQFGKESEADYVITEITENFFKK